MGNEIRSSESSEKPLPIASDESMRADAEKKLRAAAARFKQHRKPEDLQEFRKQAFRMLFAKPARSAEVIELMKELLPMVEPATPSPSSEATTKN